MKTAVVILNWNGKELLKKFLPSVVSYSREAKVYVADNASTDDSVVYINENFPSVTIIQNKSNGGYAKGYNDALSNLEEDIFILLNSDVEVTENWLLPIINYFEKHTDTAIIQPKILDYKHKQYFEYAGAGGGFIDKFGFPYCRGRIFDTLEKDEGQYDDTTPIFWASGACLAIRKTVFNQLGKLDDTYFAHQEEIDLCWRAHNAGFKTMYIGQSKVYHVGGATLTVMNPHKTYLNFRNSLFNLVKNVKGPKVFFILFFRLSQDGMAGLKFLFEGKPKHLLAVLKSHVIFYLKLPHYILKRRKIVKKDTYAHTASIVYGYFVRKKKYFRDYE